MKTKVTIVINGEINEVYRWNSGNSACDSQNLDTAKELCDKYWDTTRNRSELIVKLAVNLGCGKVYCDETIFNQLCKYKNYFPLGKILWD